MSNRHDMYIDYKRTNKRRNRKGRGRLLILLCCLLFIVGIGYVMFSYIIPGLEPAKPKAIGNITEVTPKLSQARISPTIMPTTQPAQTTTSTKVHEDTSVTTVTPDTVKGIYVPARSAASDKLEELIDLADSTEINAMVIDVKDDHGRISYAMDCDLAVEIGSVSNEITDINSLVERLKAKNIYLIARVVAFKDPFLAEKMPEYAIKNSDGSLYLDSNKEAWVNPYNRKVWQYLVEVASQAAAAGFDEVQFDYIRFSTSKAISEADFGEAAKGVSKEEIITEFTKYAYDNLKPLGVYVSADVYGTIIASSVDAELVGQNYVEMSKYLDYICPMIYPSHFGEGNFGIQYPDTQPFDIISKVLAKSAEKLDELPEDEHHAIVRPWLQDFTATWVDHHINYGSDEIREQIEGVYSVGYTEWLLWNASSNYTVDGLLEE